MMMMMMMVMMMMRLPRTWKADNAECRAEEEDGVADIVEVEILNAEHI